MLEIWITRLALLWLDGSILLLTALLSVGPYMLALAGAGLLAGRPRYRRQQAPGRTAPPQRFTLR